MYGLLTWPCTQVALQAVEVEVEVEVEASAEAEEALTSGGWPPSGSLSATTATAGEAAADSASLRRTE